MTVATKTIPKGYKQTEIGVIPADWDVKTLGDLGNVKMCRRIFNHETKKTGSIPFYKIGTFGKEADAYISQNLYEEYRRRFSFPKKGDILISAAGTIGRTIVYDGTPSYFQDSNIVWIDNDESLVSNQYLNYIFEVTKYNTEGGTIQRLYNSILSNTKFLCPTEAEQESIATALSDIDALIQKTESLIEKKKTIKQGAMQELLTGKRRLPSFSDKWEKKKIRDMADITKGQSLSKGKLSLSGKYKCILYGELFTTYDEVINFVISNTDYEEGVLSKHGDVLIPGSTTTTGIDLAKASALLLDNVLLGGDINIIRPFNKKQNSVFLAYCLTHIYKYEIAQKTKGATIFHLQGKDLLDLEINLPDEPEQTAIATILSDMDTEIEKLESELTKWRDMKQGMMQTLLTGKIRLIK